MSLVLFPNDVRLPEDTNNQAMYIEGLHQWCGEVLELY